MSRRRSASHRTQVANHGRVTRVARSAGQRANMLKWISIFFAAATLCATARACDLCGCYTPQLETTVTSDGGMPMSGAYGAVAEQSTYFNTVRLVGQEVPNRP